MPVNEDAEKDSLAETEQCCLALNTAGHLPWLLERKQASDKHEV